MNNVEPINQDFIKWYDGFRNKCVEKLMEQLGVPKSYLDADNTNKRHLEIN